MVEPDTVALDALETGARGTFVRVSDSDPEMLRYLADRGIAPGDRFDVVDRQPFGGPLFARFGSADVHVLGGALARAMRVEVRS
jgi:DtxR family Mn-dependent transcriptional regulator